MLPHPLTNFEIQKYQESEPKFKGAYSRKPKTEHWLTFYVSAYRVKYFHSFGVEHIPEEVRKFAGNKNIITNIFRIQYYDSTLWFIALDLLVLCSVLKLWQVLLIYSHHIISKGMIRRFYILFLIHYKHE